jgi:hypothetical protein
VNKGLKGWVLSTVIRSRSLEFYWTRVSGKYQSEQGRTVQVTNAYKSTESTHRVSAGAGVRQIASQRARVATEDVVRLSDAAYKADNIAEVKMRSGKGTNVGPVSMSRVLSFALVRFRAAESNSFYQATHAVTDSIVTSAGEEISVRNSEQARARNHDVEEKAKVEEVRTEEPSPVAEESSVESTPPPVVVLHPVESTPSPDPAGSLGRYVGEGEAPPTVTFVV